MSARRRGPGFVAALRARLAREARLGRALSWLVWLTMALGMALLAAAAGPRELLEAALARGLSAHLLLASVPLALAVARLLGPERADLARFAAQAGVPEPLARRALAWEAARLGSARIVVPVLALSALSASLSASLGLAARRLAAGVLLLALGAVMTSLLVVLAAALTRVSRRPRLALTLALIAPQILASAVGLPRWVGPVGAYASGRDVILDGAARAAVRER